MSVKQQPNRTGAPNRTGQPNRTSQPNRTGPGFRPRTADQLPRPEQEQEQERQLGKGLLALAGGLLLVLGVPAVLIYFVGNPLPTSLPDRSWLQADITATAIINILAVLVWIVWAHFVVCLIAEFQALRAGRLPGLVPLGGGSQVVARRLVAGLLLLAGTATMTGNAPTSGGPPDTTVVSTREVEGATADPAAPGIAALGTDARGASMSSAARALDQVGEHAAERAAVKSNAPVISYYEVKPPKGRHYDTLWDIADRTLGDPFRYKELFELNRDRVQPDGRRLVDADLIQPGWQLVMPADAKGADIQTVRARMPAAQVEPTTSPERAAGQAASDGAQIGEVTSVSAARGAAAGAAAGGSETEGLAVAGGSDTEAAATVVDDTTAAAEPVDLGELALGGGMVLAGLLLALSTRRGPYGTPGETDQALRLAANPGRADLLDRALRLLSEGRRNQSQPMPDAAAVYVNDDQVVVHVAGRPAPPPAPWQQADEGRSWTVRREDLEGAASRAPAPWPGLVSIAESHGYDLLVDLEYAPGLISLGGSPEVSREVALSLAVDLVTHAWSDAVEVTMVGFGDDLSAIAPDRIRQVPSIEEAMVRAQEADAASRLLLRSLGVDGVLAGRAAGRVEELRPQVLILSGTPGPERAQQLTDLAGNGRSVLTTVCVGNTLAARWRFTTEREGTIDLGALGMSGTARRLTPEALSGLQDLLRDAGTESAERSAEAAVRSPAAVAAALSALATAGAAAGTDPQGSDPQGTDPHGTDPLGGGAVAARVDRHEALAHVSLLGPVQVQAPGTVNPARLGLLTELATLVALHPEGVHESVLRVALWPRGVEDDVVHSTLAAAQHWLGKDGAGADLLEQGEDGRWRLGRQVHVDWHEFVATAAAHQDDAHRLVEALDLARGVAFSGVPAGRYSWLAFHLAARDARALVTAVARRAAGRLLTADDRHGAERALRQGLTLVPAAQALWRDLIRLLGDRDPIGASGVAAEMRQGLGGSPMEPETQALVQHLVPEQDKIS